MRVEICIGSLQSALNAYNAGAYRVELCSALSLGGITPSAGLIKRVRESVPIDVNVLIRPRQGDFLYSASELNVMLDDIKICADYGVNGVVVGALNEDGDIDIDSSARMINLAKELGLSVTFHRAIDRSRDIIKSVEDIIGLGADRILSSGGANSAYQGMSTIKAMNSIANKRIIIMPGAGINSSNIKEIVSKTGVSEIHFSASEAVESGMKYREGISFTPQELGGDYIMQESAYHKIKDTIRSL